MRQDVIQARNVVGAACDVLALLDRDATGADGLGAVCVDGC